MFPFASKPDFECNILHAVSSLGNHKQVEAKTFSVHNFDYLLRATVVNPPYGISYFRTICVPIILSST